jgi:hypothetical protein
VVGKRNKGQAPHSADTRAVNGIRGFAGIPKCVVESPAHRGLSLISRAILVEIVARMVGNNNGAIHISYAELAKCLNRKNQAPIGPAIAELMQHGLLDISAESVWQVRKSREYRLTFVNTSDSIGRPIKATNDYLNWKPREKNDATDVVAAKVKSATAFVASKSAAATDAVADANGKPPKTFIGSATDGVVPILSPYPERAASDCSGHSAPQIADGPFADPAVMAARDRITGHWKRLKTAARRRSWAASHGLTVDELREYIVVDPLAIPFVKQAALASAIRAEQRAAQKAKRGAGAGA